MTETNPTERLIYIGRRATSNGKLAYWYTREEDPRGPATGSYKAYGAFEIGAIVEITRPADAPEQLYVSGQHQPRAVDVWTEESDIADWRLLDRADYQAHQTEARVRKQLKGVPDEFEEAVNVLARHFAKLNTTQRAALLSVVQARILGRLR